jgi:hypothetical protein
MVERTTEQVTSVGQIQMGGQANQGVLLTTPREIGCKAFRSLLAALGLVEHETRRWHICDVAVTKSLYQASKCEPALAAFYPMQAAQPH